MLKFDWRGINVACKDRNLKDILKDYWINIQQIQECSGGTVKKIELEVEHEFNEDRVNIFVTFEEPYERKVEEKPQA